MRLPFNMAKRPPSRPPVAQKPRRLTTPLKVWKRIHLKEWREHRGLSTEKLAEESGVSPGLISQIENRRSAGSADSLEKLAKALKIQVGELLDVKPEKNGAMLRVFVADNERELVQRFLDALKRDKS